VAKSQSKIPKDSKSPVLYLLPFLTVAAMALGIFFQTGDNYTPNVLMKLLGLAVPLVVGLVFLIVINIKPQFLLLKFELMWALAWLIYLILRGVASPNLGHALIGEPSRNLGILTTILFILFFYAGRLIGFSGKSQILLNGFIGIAFVEAAVVIYQSKFAPLTFVGIPKVAVQPAVVGSFYNANPLSFFLGISVSALFVYLLNLENKKIRIFLPLAAIELVIFYALVLSNSSQGIVVAFFIIVLFSSKRFIPLLNKYFSSIQVLLYGVAFFIFIAVVLLVPLTDPSRIAANPYLERLEIYKSAMKIFLANPLAGVGIDSFSSDYGKYTVTTLMQLVDNAHSIPLHLMSTQGVVGFLFYGVFIIWIFNRKLPIGTTSKAEWGFWQSGFYAYALIGIIGIEYPALGAIAFLSAGVITSLSGKVEVTSSVNSKSQSLVKSSRFFVLMLSVFVLFSLSTFADTEFRVARNIAHLSEGKLSAAEFKTLLAKDFKKLQNAQLLLTAGQALIAINDERDAIAVANKMLESFPRDQRTSVLFLTIGNTWGNEEAIRIGSRIRDELFP
jgi:hypothetical protein